MNQSAGARTSSRATTAPDSVGSTTPSQSVFAATEQSGARVARRLEAFVLLFFLWVLLKNAWLCEDAFITFRVVDNFVHGLGLRWNPLERVQVYTHPLWMFGVSAIYAVTRDMYVSAMALSVVCTGVAARLVLREMRSPAQVVVAGAVMTFSKAFVDFSTGGLENPLSHLLLALFLVEYLKPDDARCFPKMIWFAGLALVNRIDLVWLFVPPVIHLAFTRGYGQRRHGFAWLGFLPFFAWEGFSFLYYGFFLPNSAYAKVFTDVDKLEIVRQGGCYFLNSLAWDPLTLFATVALIGSAFHGAKRDSATMMMAIGIVLQLTYTALVGGDYMSGRFFAEPLLVALLILSRWQFDSLWESSSALGAVLALGLYSPRPPIQTSEGYIGLGSAPQSVDDERGYRHNDTSLLRLNRRNSMKDLSGWVAAGLKARRENARVTVFRNIGYYGFFAGPGVHIIDPYGLGDPLLARLPFRGSWTSIGHFARKVPDGYPEAAIDDGEIADPEIAAYWSKIKLVTRGPLLDRGRLTEVVRFNLGLNPAPRSSR